MAQDILEKRAQYIIRSNKLVQEFNYTHPTTKCRLNNIYNSHFTGSRLWNLFNNASEKLEKTWNVSQGIMFSLPREAHRYFTEPLSGQHLKSLLINRFL